MRRLFTLGLIALVAVITGCANNANIDTNKDYWQHKPNTVVIVTTHTDKPQYADENAGSRGAIVEIVNLLSTQKLENHLNQMDVDWYYQDLAEQFKEALVKENIKVVVASEHPDLKSSTI